MAKVLILSHFFLYVSSWCYAVGGCEERSVEVEAAKLDLEKMNILLRNMPNKVDAVEVRGRAVSTEGEIGVPHVVHLVLVRQLTTCFREEGASLL